MWKSKSAIVAFVCAVLVLTSCHAPQRESGKRVPATTEATQDKVYFTLSEFDGELVMQSIHRLDDMYDKYSCDEPVVFESFKFLEKTYLGYVSHYTGKSQQDVIQLQKAFHAALQSASKVGIQYKLYDPRLGMLYNLE